MAPSLPMNIPIPSVEPFRGVSPDSTLWILAYPSCLSWFLTWHLTAWVDTPVDPMSGISALDTSVPTSRYWTYSVAPPLLPHEWAPIISSLPAVNSIVPAPLLQIFLNGGSSLAPTLLDNTTALQQKGTRRVGPSRLLGRSTPVPQQWHVVWNGAVACGHHLFWAPTHFVHLYQRDPRPYLAQSSILRFPYLESA